MTTQEMQKIVAALQPLDQFASQTPLPRPWHAQWQAIFEQAATTIRAITDKKPAEDSESPPDK